MKNVEDIYPLSPMQQGILFHTLYAPKSGMYCEQFHFAIHGDFNISAFKQAWQQLIERHQVLRTFFIWEDVKEPVQVVQKQTRLPWEQQDWRRFTILEKQKRLKDFLRKEQEWDFKVSQAPLMRVTLIQLAEDEYQFIWNRHHLLMDGWSTPIIFEELFAFYKAFNQGQTLHLGQPCPYRDYVAWLQHQDLSQAEEFWRRRLKGFTTTTSLRVDRQLGGSISQGNSYDHQKTQLSEAATTALRGLAQQQQLTLNTLIQGAWALLLSRYSGEKDVVFGAVISGRPPTLAGANSMVGVFINTLPVRAYINSGEFLVPWLKKLQKQQNEARQYEYSPLIEVSKWSDIAPGLPLFENILNFQTYQGNFSSQQLDSNLKISEISTFAQNHYPLTVSVEADSELSLDIFYDCQRFDADTITRMLGHFQTLLEGIVAAPEQRLVDLPILTQTEQQQLLVEWNATQTDYPKDLCIHQLFEAQVDRTPNAIAVVFEDQQLTYQELNSRANQLAHHLQELGVSPEVLVGICMERSLEMVVGLLGIFKAGGAYVPIDPAYPSERLAFILQDTQVPVLLTQQNLLETLPPHQAKVFCLETNWNQIAQHSPENPTSRASAENLAYVIYTSGSTGRPKGVMNIHRGICNRLLWMQNAYQLTVSDRVVQKTPFSFDVSVWEFFWPLINGASLVIAQPGGHQDSAYLVKLISSQQITTIHFVPSMLQVFLQEQTLEECNCLKRVICSGEALSWEQQNRFFERLDAELHNLYGPTEAAIDVTFWQCQCQNDLPIVPIGRAITNTQIYLLDQHLQPVPLGVPGELHIGGDGLARSYLNRPELTAEKFIANPFSTQPGARLYKTGDLARYLPNGEIQYLGRIDHQVKIRGFRIELGEIETALSQHPVVQANAVVVREDEPGSKHLIAYVVLHSEQTLTTTELCRFLQEKLPSSMVPSAFVTLDALPLTLNGKVDRKALPAPYKGRPNLESAYVAPRTSTEQILADIWIQVLGLERVGVHDNFVEVGGDSILSIQVISRARQADLHLTPQHLFDYPTIAELATVAGKATTIGSEQKTVIGSVPLTPIQHWFFEQNLLDVHHWNQAVLLEVSQNLNPERLQKVVEHLLKHHDSLRLRFRQSTGGWQQINTSPDDRVPFTSLDLSARSPQEQQSVMAATTAKLQASLNLSEGPLLQVAWFNLGSHQPNRLLLIIHHLAVDGVSWRILLEDFQTAYNHLSRSKTIQLPPKTTAFKRWAEQLREYANSDTLRQELDYWSTIAEQPVKILPIDFPGGANTVATRRTTTFTLGATDTQALLQEIPMAYRVQIHEVLLTALVQTFSQWMGTRSLLIDLEGHGREAIFDHVDVSRTIGWFTTIFPMFLDLGPTSNLGDALTTIKEQLRCIPNRGLGYGVLRYLCSDRGVSQELQALPQAEVSFNYLGQFDQLLSEDSLFRPTKESIDSTRSQRGNRRYLIEVEGMVVGGQLQLDWTYSQTLHHPDTVESLMQGMATALRSLINHGLSGEIDRYTPSDFPEAELTQVELDKVFEEIGLD